MTQQFDDEQVVDAQGRRGRGPTKPYPMVSFEDALQLARGILEHGVSGEIERLTLMDKLNLSPNSSKTRVLITNSSKYGLTVGSYNVPAMRLTEDASTVLSSNISAQAAKQKEFDLAIGQFEHFSSVYERIKENRLRDEAVLKGELGRAGVPELDRQKTVEVFIENLRFVGLVENIDGSDQVRSIETIVSRLASAESDENPESGLSSIATPDALPSLQTADRDIVAGREPTVHIDIQIHIDSSATSEQIEQIFASMARHVYGREG